MTREDLKNFEYSDKWIKRMLEKYEERKTAVENITGKLDGMPKARNKSNYKVEEFMDNCNKMIDVLNEDQKQLNKIVLQLREVPEPHRLLLTDKYILGMKLDDVAYDIGYAYENVCRMHGIALNIFDEIGTRQ